MRKRSCDDERGPGLDQILNTLRAASKNGRFAFESERPPPPNTLVYCEGHPEIPRTDTFSVTSHEPDGGGDAILCALQGRDAHTWIPLRYLRSIDALRRTLARCIRGNMSPEDALISEE